MRIAVIGSGIAGLGAAWLLSQRHNVTVFERNGYAGGHSNTVDAPFGASTVPVDTGFIVLNERTYPNLLGLFGELDVPLKRSDMSFGVSVDGGRLEYSGSGWNGLFAQRRNLVSPRFHAMLRDIFRFYRTAPALVDGAEPSPLTLGEFLDAGGYGDAFVDDHLLPMAAAIWSCSTARMRDFPAESFVRFFLNHGLLELRDRPQWWTVDGGSREYVARIRRRIDAGLMLNTPAVSVRRVPGGVQVASSDGETRVFDRVVLACHGDEAFALLADKTDREAEVLGGFGYERNIAVLHSDPAQMPRRRRVWSSWNYLAEKGADTGRVAVTYWMNRLQSIDPACPLFVTLNPLRPVDPATEIARFAYDHPIFDRAAIDAQRALPGIQGRGGVWYCGSYCGYGFHEDALASAVAVARALGAEIPWGQRPHPAMDAVGAPAVMEEAA